LSLPSARRVCEIEITPRYKSRSLPTAHATAVQRPPIPEASDPRGSQSGAAVVAAAAGAAGLSAAEAAAGAYEGAEEQGLAAFEPVEPGDEFQYVFDLGGNWSHRCVLDSAKADPRSEYGVIPPRPVAIWGWGSIPEQYGRESFEGDETE
jgi:hypothetical protein